MNVERYELFTPEPVLADLRERLGRTRLPPGQDADWDAGTSPDFLLRLVAHWRGPFDWRAQEATLNELAHFHAEVSGLRIHFVHERGRGERPLPLLLTHGYPDSFLRFAEIIPLLTDPKAYGGDPADSFDVVVPSLPGYGFSDAPKKDGGIFHAADLFHELMTKALGYARFGAHGGDWGSTVTDHLARSHGRSLVGIHLTDVPFWHTFQKPHDATAAEKELFARTDAFMQKEGAYAMVQGTRPNALVPGLMDSPAGLAAWLVEKFQSLSDCGGDVESRFTMDELLTNVMLYWTTGTIGSAFGPYADLTHAGAMRWIVEKAKDWVASSRVPAGFAIFPKDTQQPPREWAERFYDVRRFTEMPRGGHFTAMEEPQLLAEELRAFFRPLRGS